MNEREDTGGTVETERWFRLNLLCREAPFLTFDGTLFSDMSFETIPPEELMAKRLTATSAVNPTIPERALSK